MPVLDQVLNRWLQPEDSDLSDNILQIGGTQNIVSGGALNVESGGELNIESGAALNISGDLDSPGGVSLKTQRLVLPLGDISSAGSVFVFPGFAGTILAWRTVIDGAIITLPAGLTLEIGGTAVTDGAIAIVVSGSAAGVVDSAIPSALNVFTNIQPIEVVKDGDSTNAVNAVAVFDLLVA